MLTEQELINIFSWRPYREDWTVDRNKIDDNINSHYGNLIIGFTQNTSFDTYYSEDGGLGNYLEFICYPTGQNQYNGNAILVCISLCSPFATYGQITISKEHNSFGWGQMFSPDTAYEILDTTLKMIESKIKNILTDNRLCLLDNEFLSRQLPSEIADNLKFENHNEGTQYLQGIFQKTD